MAAIHSRARTARCIAGRRLKRTPRNTLLKTTANMPQVRSSTAWSRSAPGKRSTQKRRAEQQSIEPGIARRDNAPSTKPLAQVHASSTNKPRPISLQNASDGAIGRFPRALPDRSPCSCGAIHEYRSIHPLASHCGGPVLSRRPAVVTPLPAASEPWFPISPQRGLPCGAPEPERSRSARMPVSPDSAKSPRTASRSAGVHAWSTPPAKAPAYRETHVVSQETPRLT